MIVAVAADVVTIVVMIVVDKLCLPKYIKSPGDFGFRGFFVFKIWEFFFLGLIYDAGTDPLRLHYLTHEFYMKKILIALGCVIMVLFSSTAHAQSKTITAAADPWPPFITPDSPSQGLSMEVVTAAFKTQGYDVKLEIVPWNRAENGVKEGSYDILPNTWKNEKRLSYLTYSAPYASNQIKFIKRKGDAFEYTGLSSLAGKIVGTVSGYGYSSDFTSDTGFEREPTGDLITNIKKLVRGRIDLTLSDEIVAKAVIAQEDSSLLDKIAFTKEAMSSNDLFVTCGLANPRHQEIIEAFNKGLAAIKADGTFKKIMAKYGIR